MSGVSKREVEWHANRRQHRNSEDLSGQVLAAYKLLVGRVMFKMPARILFTPQLTFRPKTNFVKATKAAVLNDTKVNATSAMRASKPRFSGVTANKLNP